MSCLWIIWALSFPEAIENFPVAWLGRHRERKVGFLKGEGFTRLVGPKNRAMVLTVLTRA